MWLPRRIGQGLWTVWTTFERRQLTLSMSTERSRSRVSSQAEFFDASETTIRNDHSPLEEENRLPRVHGRAVAHTHCTPPHVRRRDPLRQRRCQEAHRRWAADGVQDGDSIFLDANTTVVSVAPLLQKYRNLATVTTGIEVARHLAENPSNTVVLIGGIVDTNGRSITSLIGGPMIQSLHFTSAFISCVGFSLESGLTERNIDEAQLKQELLTGAQPIIALVDSAKFEQVGLAPFADHSEITYLVTDSVAEPETINRIQQRGIRVTGRGEDSVRSYNVPHSQETIRIEFANLPEESQFAVNVRPGL